MEEKDYFEKKERGEEKGEERKETGKRMLRWWLLLSTASLRAGSRIELRDAHALTSEVGNNTRDHPGPHLVVLQFSAQDVCGNTHKERSGA